MPKHAAELSCQRVIALLTEHAGPIPDAADQRTVEAHLHACPACAHWQRTLQAALALFGTAANVEVPEATRRRLRQHFSGVEVPW
ncbi:MAG TPA: hypothetical protein VNP04_13405 [Alphaproteobacteria bacterium]|nr:hypothetical protein [Alphaproteobacteria bacterium]